MKTEIGEYIVGAYLKIIKNCDFVDYNVRPPGGGMKGLNELDVIGINFKDNTAFLCEVTTHITGLLIKDYKTTLDKISQKYKKQREYAKKYLKNFPKCHFMFWSPIVSKEKAKKLERNKGLELIINERYTSCINELKEKAKTMTNDTGNPFFRMLQIIERLK